MLECLCDSFTPDRPYLTMITVDKMKLKVMYIGLERSPVMKENKCLQYKVATVHAAPVYLDLEKTTEKACLRKAL